MEHNEDTFEDIANRVEILLNQIKNAAASNRCDITEKAVDEILEDYWTPLLNAKTELHF